MFFCEFGKIFMNSSFFLSVFSFIDIGNSKDSRGREGAIFYFTLPLPPAHRHWDFYLQLCKWDDYHVLLIAPLVFTTLLRFITFALLNYHLIDWWCNVNFFTCLLDDLILGFWTALLHTASEQLLRRFTRK